MLHHADDVVVGVRERGRVGLGDRDVLAKVVRPGLAQTGQPVDELLDATRRDVAGATVRQMERDDAPKSVEAVAVAPVPAPVSSNATAGAEV